MLEQTVFPALADTAFGLMRAQTAVYDAFKLPVISTGRPFSFYRHVFFDDRSEADVLAELAGKTVVDIGCGLTPFVKDSMFQVANAAGVEFYGVDPKIGSAFKFGPFDRLKVFFTGGRGGIDPEAPYLERAIGTYANQLPMADGKVDAILSSWLLTVWVRDEALLAEIFTEFWRVLKPGGSVQIYPQRYWRPERLENADLKNILQRFVVEQKFIAGFRIMNSPPAYTTTLTKPLA